MDRVKIYGVSDGLQCELNSSIRSAMAKSAILTAEYCKLCLPGVAIFY